MDAAIALAKFAAELKYEDLPPDAVEATKMDILDTLGSAIAGSTAAGVKEVVELARELGEKETSTIISHGIKVAPTEAALANGLMAHALDYDDTHDAAVIHAGCTVVTASFAIAEQVGGISGKDFIAAVTAGIDIGCRMSYAMNLPPALSGWIYTPLCGYFSSAAAVSRILKLDEEKIVNALGIAHSQAAGNQQGVYDGALTKRLQAGLAARGGVLSALLAQKGYTGARNSLEGKTGLYNLYLHGDYNPVPLTAELGKRFEVVNLSFKPYSCCRLNHNSIDATLALVKEHDVKVQDVKEITALVGKSTYALLCEPLEIKRRPRTVVDSQFSLPYSIAVAIAHRQVTVKDFSEDAIKDPTVLEVAQRVTPKLTPELETRGIEPAIVEIKMKNGRVYSKRVDYPYGHPRSPMDIPAKFRDCALYAARRLSKENVEKVIHLVNRLEKLEDVSQVIRLLA